MRDLLLLAVSPRRGLGSFPTISNPWGGPWGLGRLGPRAERIVCRISLVLRARAHRKLNITLLNEMFRCVMTCGQRSGVWPKAGASIIGGSMYSHTSFEGGKNELFSMLQ
jgi:hypothetical protein